MNDEIKKENTKSEAALREERILEFWREQKTFQKSLDKKSPKGHYVFYDGPPFATGQIHYGHILGSTAKDVIGRYKTMQGYYVPRKWGWDCHGLPIENIVEKELGIAGHVEIEKYGIDKFVEYARSKVLQYDKDWEKGIERIGRWVDFRGQYKTMDNTFIESVWWALAELNKKNLIYEGVRVLAYCARCETPIANSEIAMDNSYKDISDISVYVKFELADEPGTYLLAWTTTPWTLPGNTAIAINKDIDYVKIEHQGSFYILAKDSVKNVIKEFNGAETKFFKGSELVGKKYKPVFPYYQNSEIAKNENVWKVWHADFVTLEKGTGIAHEAPAFGEDDMNLAKEHNIPWIIHVDETGRFRQEVTDFAGLQVKPKGAEKDDHQKADIEVIKYLAKNNALFAKEKIIHSYPHCMRCDTPIIYYALPSWFINIQNAKPGILKTAEKINWIPAHLKEGRFKNIAENAPDWNISRNRYWASPLPIWKCFNCKKQTFVSSLEDLKNKTKKSGNKYFIVRHGEALFNAKHIGDPQGDPDNHLTKEGEKEAVVAGELLKDNKIDLIFSSPFIRTSETAEILRRQIGLPESSLIVDERLHELNEPDQSFVRKRMAEFIFEVEKTYQGKNVAIVSHGNPLWVLEKLASWHSSEHFSEEEMLLTAEVREIFFVPFPHNANYELDLHRPYIDELPLLCAYSTDSGQACGGNLTRIPEVLDCWFESGSMPFAQDHYPFENKNWQKNNFPAGFVAEYIAQTRTWFYYTHVVSAILFGHTPFRNIVTTGTLRAEDGEKMSKSKQNYPDPWIFIDKYGVDALRIYLMSSTLMKGEDANFSEKAVQDIASKIIGRLFNVLAFYELYRDEKLEENETPKSKNVLDKWILSRSEQVLEEVTKGMENYDMAEATRPLDLFVDDLSTWYLRRSRERIKEGDKNAKQTLYYVLKNISKLIAPLAPFAAEDIWLKLRHDQDEESVHLAGWPRLTPWPLSELRRWVGEGSVLKNMEQARKIVSLGLEARQKAKIPVRQPLAMLKFQVESKKLASEYLELIKDELNVKEVVEDKNIETEVLLDTKITPELKEEGNYRELLRALQDMRKEKGLTPSDVVRLTFATSDAGQKLVQKFETDMKKTVLVSKIDFKNTDGDPSASSGQEIKIDDLVFGVRIDKI